METQTLILKPIDIYLEEEDEELIKLQYQAAQLAEIFKELNTFICEQGEKIELIEDNIVKTAVHVEQAQENLIVAEQNQRRGMKLKIFLAALLTGAVTGPVGVFCGAKAAIGTCVGVGVTSFAGVLFT